MGARTVPVASQAAGVERRPSPGEQYSGHPEQFSSFRRCRRRADRNHGHRLATSCSVEQKEQLSANGVWKHRHIKRARRPGRSETNGDNGAVRVEKVDRIYRDNR